MERIKNTQLLDFLQDFFGEEFESFLNYLHTPPRLFVRLNNLKANPVDTLDSLEKQGFQLEKISWIENVYEVKFEPFPISKTIEHFLGHIYIQDLSSLVPALLLMLKPGEKVLDIASAPGSKTTQMSEILQNTGVIVANDVNMDRLRALSHNIDKTGAFNTIITWVDGYKLGIWLENYFDKVIVDVPCSALGTLKENREIFKWWSWDKVRLLTRTQKSLIISGFKALKPGGIMVYSTCTLVPYENEGIVNFLLTKFPQAEVLPVSIEIGLKTRSGLIEFKSTTFGEEMWRTFYIVPHWNNIEGFYVALIRKNKET